MKVLAPQLTRDRLNRWDAFPTIPGEPTHSPGGSARRTIVGAIACGLTGDLLMHSNAGKVVFSGWALLALVTVYAVLRARAEHLDRATVWLLMIAALFAILFSVRDSALVTAGNFLAFGVALSLAIAVSTPSFSLRTAQIREVISAGFLSGCDVAFGALAFVFGDLSGAFSVSATRRYGLRLFLRGITLAVLLLVVFGTLLRSADPVFDHGLSVLTAWGIPEFSSHVFAFALGAWPAVGLQWRGGRGSSLQEQIDSIALPTFLNRVDVLSILSGLNLLFGAFVAVQLRVLFGGQAYVLATTGLTVAQYARDGFFALFFAGGLVLCVLLAMNSFVNDGGISVSSAARRLSWSLMALVGVVLTSAVVRMALYVSVFGASTERVYAFGAMSWLVAVLVLFGATILRNLPNAFALGALAISAAFGLLFNVVNTEALVTGYNLQRAAGGAGFDMRYARSLGADAVPALTQGIVSTPISALSKFNDQNKAGSPSACVSVGEFVLDWTSPTRTETVGWNLSRLRARHVVAQNLGALQARACAKAGAPALSPLH